jgi:hypothetical protein
MASPDGLEVARPRRAHIGLLGNPNLNGISTGFVCN